MKESSVIDLGSGKSADLASAERKEWLVTNGIGGFAMGTVAGMLSRRYHGLLIAAQQPPLGRRLLVTKLDEIAGYNGQKFPLFVNRWVAGELDLDGFQHLRKFHLEGTRPVWTYALEDALLEKRIWMQDGANTTYVQYTLTEGTGPLDLSAKVLLNDRDYHGLSNAGEILFRFEQLSDGLQVESSTSKKPYYILSRDMTFEVQDQWYENYYLSVERYRGLPEVEAHYYGALARVVLTPGQSAILAASTEPYPELDGSKALIERASREHSLLERAHWYVSNSVTHDINKPEQAAASVSGQRILAADQFVVKRSTAEDPSGQTIIAGYPWFGDWGRDTMIALPGLTLSTGRADIAAMILRTFASYVNEGMLPNRFPDQGEIPEYNTVDATLWYFEALRAYLELTGDIDLVKELFPVLEEIVKWHVKGTRYNIGLDPVDGLIYAGESGVQLTWMDAKVADWVVTPRIGKPVEINALWYNALNIMAAFAELIGESAATFVDLANKTHEGFRRYWNHDAGYCYDVLDGPGGNDPALRPNQIFAVSLPYSPLQEYQKKAVVDVCSEQLLTSHGMRSLSSDHSEYKSVYGGDVKTRDGAYHQGTVWGWLIGPCITAHLRVYGDRERAISYLQPLLDHVYEHGVGSISEIFDGDPPNNPRGCPAQAWSVAEVLRTLEILHRPGSA